MNIAKIVNNDGKGYWVDFLDDTQIKIKPATPKKMNQLFRSCEKKGWTRGRSTSDMDSEKFNILLCKEIILDWKGFFVEDGSEFPCTEENKKVLMENWTEFNRFVQETALNVEQLIAEEKAGTEKN
jgi:hypothetical protein